MTQEHTPSLEFGTGGIRGVMGLGKNCINAESVKRIIHGFCNYIDHYLTLNEKQSGIVIAYDSRHNSDQFAKLIAEVCAARDIPVFIFDELTATPLLSFTIRYLKCLGGICITASHNPPQYNGIKIYWRNGAQIIPPQDADIIKYIRNVDDKENISLIEFYAGLQQNKIKYVPQSVFDAYFEDLLAVLDFDHSEKHSLQNTESKLTKNSLSIVYTPLHGTGLKPVTKLLELLNCTNFFVVPEQAQPDGSFSTVHKPNPEESESLELAVKYASKRNADVIFATDPDADRLAICVKDPEHARGIYKTQSIGDYILLNGNQTSALLLNFILSSLKKHDKLNAHHKAIKTIVTTGLLENICQSYDIQIFNTPTGFKWIASLIEQWETTQPEYKFLFGCEESLGYMLANNVRDKDSIAALGCAVKMLADYQSKHMSACDGLFEIFRKFGVWQEDLISFEFENTSKGLENIVNIMKYFRITPPKSFGGVCVKETIDYLVENKGYFFPKMDVLQFILNDQSQISIRPSGTEPKLKIYISACTKSPVDALNQKNNIVEGLHLTHDKIQKLRYDLSTKVTQIIHQ